GIEVPALYRSLGAAPAMLEAWLAFAWALRREAGTPRALRELVILRGAQVAGAAYEWAHHVPMAREAGVAQARIDALAGWRGSDLFDEAERAALARLHLHAQTVQQPRHADVERGGEQDLHGALVAQRRLQRGDRLGRRRGPLGHLLRRRTGRPGRLLDHRLLRGG
ncbi:MAG: carboxymuconolactone decarboxylase family protein, partial [Pseudomonadota bacterium]